MLAARMHGYSQPLVLEEVNIPEISSEQVLVRVGGAGMCRSDVQLFEDINENLEMLRRGDIIGRAVIVFDVKVNQSDRKEAKDATAPGRGASQAGSSATQG